MNELNETYAYCVNKIVWMNGKDTYFFSRLRQQFYA